jgi:hypothetical protein
MRKTSLDIYRQILDSGFINDSQKLVYSYLCDHGPTSTGKVNKILQRPDEVHPSYHRRVEELEVLGLTCRVGKGPCPVTGNSVDLWDVTANVPVKPDPPPKKPDLLTRETVIDSMCSAADQSVREYGEFLRFRIKKERAKVDRDEADAAQAA